MLFTLTWNPWVVVEPENKDINDNCGLSEKLLL